MVAFGLSRALDREDLNESEETAVQCDGCGYWTLHSWTDDQGEGGTFDLCPKCDRRADLAYRWPK